ncbi:hypothetical protein RN607_14280 [Demequina capsici]|uniref:Uncharacterized protein n=1 Tax=Demequina capsici TaxID=3075620 RepID=A0AA96FD57_9MICO|nr:hypothetical protein [Demequina sp. PMTSA13]WNM27347.1 hypothetical protein RN607_14280 [Demequina sp. PMTSA13]
MTRFKDWFGAFVSAGVEAAARVDFGEYAGLALMVDEATATVGYPWPGGLVLTDLDDERAKRTIIANHGVGITIPGIGWISLVSPAGGLLLDDDLPLEPEPPLYAPWVRMAGYTDGYLMAVAMLDADDRVVYALGAGRSAFHAPLLAAAALRSVEEVEDLPHRAHDLFKSPPTKWSHGWSINRDLLVP